MKETKMKKTEKKVAVQGKESLPANKNKTICNDKDCHVHGNLKVRGRTFEGRVTKKYPKRVKIEFERMIYIRKYERYTKLMTKIHARLPVCMDKDIQIGDLIKIQECRPLSKIIHFVVIKKIEKKENKK